MRFEQSTGLSFNIARARGISSFTLFALLNLAAITYLIELAGGPHISIWIARHPWALGMVATALLGVHVVLGKAIRQSPESKTKSGNGAAPAKVTYFWAWYIAATISFWVITCAVVIMHLANPNF